MRTTTFIHARLQLVHSYQPNMALIGLALLMGGHTSTEPGSARAAGVILRFLAKLRSRGNLQLFRAFQKWTAVAASSKRKQLAGNGGTWAMPGFANAN